MNTLVDIAGGHGMLLSGFLKTTPHLRGVLFDLPEVIEGAPALLEKEGVADRVKMESGDFFEKVTKAADAYMMKFIIHDWDDERALRILRNIHRDSAPSPTTTVVAHLTRGGPSHPWWPSFPGLQNRERSGAERPPSRWPTDNLQHHHNRGGPASPDYRTGSGAERSDRLQRGQ